jgi:hypothetical protein
MMTVMMMMMIGGRREGRRPGHGPVGEQFEDERGGDLVGHVGDADVEVGQVDLHEVAQDELELVSVGTAHRTIEVHVSQA